MYALRFCDSRVGFAFLVGGWSSTDKVVSELGTGEGAGRLPLFFCGWAMDEMVS